MAHTLEGFLALDLSKLRESRDAQGRCASCDKELRENMSGYRMCEGGPRCSDCYFKELGDLVEEAGVGLPYVRR